jgi:hypothetical protein
MVPIVMSCYECVMNRGYIVYRCVVWYLAIRELFYLLPLSYGQNLLPGVEHLCRMAWSGGECVGNMFVGVWRVWNICVDGMEWWDVWEICLWVCGGVWNICVGWHGVVECAGKYVCGCVEGVEHLCWMAWSGEEGWMLGNMFVGVWRVWNIFINVTDFLCICLKRG